MLILLHSVARLISCLEVFLVRRFLMSVNKEDLTIHGVRFSLNRQEANSRFSKCSFLVFRYTNFVTFWVDKIGVAEIVM